MGLVGWVLTLASLMVQAQVSFDQLGGNQELFETLKAVNPQAVEYAVQPRWFSIRKRLAMGLGYQLGISGLTYVQSQGVGVQLSYGLTDRLSVSFQSLYHMNLLTPEGRAVINRALEYYQQDPSQPQAEFPQISYLQWSHRLLGEWAPLYGKVSLLGFRVIQFDGFLGLGVGLTQLNTNSHIHPVGVVGSRFFVNPNQALRLDLQYSRPQAQYWDRTVTVDLWSLNAQWSYIF